MAINISSLIIRKESEPLWIQQASLPEYEIMILSLESGAELVTPPEYVLVANYEDKSQNILADREEKEMSGQDQIPFFTKKKLEEYFWLINERHAIYRKKNAGRPWPWTTDEILQKNKFCNVFRELDTVTIWIRENWREPYAKHRNLWFAMCVARQINWPPTLAAIGFPRTWNPVRVADKMHEMKKKGLQVYTGAYMLTGTMGGDKIDQTVFKILDPLFRDPPNISKTRTLEETAEILKERPGFGRFLSYEVVTDLRHTRYLQNAPDIMTWANAGPGAMRGINRLLGLKAKPKQQLSTEGYLIAMRKLLELSPSYLADYVPPLELREIEHCLCEFDKYQRIKNGEGKMRSRYHPPGLVT